jgi:hypothetical protein
MKNSFKKILAVGMTLALVSSFFAAVPVSAAPGCNAWDDIPMPVLAPDTEPGVMDIAPDGTMFLALYYEGDYTGSFGTALTWDILYSTDGGFNWKKTNLTEIVDHNPNALYDFDDGGVENAIPVRIQVSPMWPDNKNVYVALSNGKVWRLPNAGLGTPSLLKPLVSNNATYLEDMGMAVWDMDIWSDGTYNYLAVATDLDVFVVRDQLLNDWIDYELNVENDADWDDNRKAVEVRFAPDFATSELIWAVTSEWDEWFWPLDYDPYWEEDDLILTSADSPARWGLVYDEVAFEPYDYDDWPNYEKWTPFVDMEFDPAYTSQNPQVYVAIAQPYWNSEPYGWDDGNLYLVTGEASSTGPGETFSSYIFFEDRALGSVEVSGNTIMVQDTEYGTVWTTTDGGANWDEAARSPAADFWGQLYMSPNFEEDQTVFSTVMDGNQSWAGVGGVYRSIDGGEFFDGISMLDMDIEFIQDLAFDPMGGSQPVLMLVEYNDDTYIFYTPDATAAAPQWLLKDNEEIYDVWDITMISWDAEGDTVMFMARQDPWEIYRSTDGGNSFKFWRTVPSGTIGEPKDWVVVDYSMVNVIGDDGYWGTRPVGTPITSTVPDSAGITPFVSCSIDRYEDDGDVMLAVGLEDGAFGISEDNGASWDMYAIAGADETYVAFGPDGKLYAATNQGGTIVEIDPSDGSYAEVEDSNADVAVAEGFSGIWVSPDNTLYAIGDQIIPGSTAEEEEAYGSLQMVNDDPLFPGTATLDLEELEYVIENEALDSDSSISFSVISGAFNQGEILYVVGDDLVWAPDEDIYLAGDVLVQGAESGAFGRISLSVSIATAEFMIDEGTGFYTDGWSDSWPEMGYSVSITSSTLILNFEDIEGEEATATTMFRLLLGDDESDYNVWETKNRAGAFGLWGTVGSNIAWTVVEGDTIWAFEDFNSGMVQGVNVTEVNKSAANASKDLKIDWTALACTTCYTIWIDGEPYTNVTVASTTAAGAALTKTLKGFDYATEYEVQVQACVDGPLQSRLSAVDDVTTECYCLAPAAMVPVQGMQDASTAPSFVWGPNADGCAPTGYDFQLSTDPAFATTIVSISTTNTGYTYTAGDLAYDTNHYWRVRSSCGTLKSAWTTIQNFHTMLEPQPPVDITITQPPDVNLTVPPVVTVPPAQTITVSVPPAVTLTQTVTSVPTPTITLPDQPTPAYIWVIVAVGAILTIAVIVLIIRTRRAE